MHRTVDPGLRIRCAAGQARQRPKDVAALGRAGRPQVSSRARRSKRRTSRWEMGSRLLLRRILDRDLKILSRRLQRI